MRFLKKNDPRGEYVRSSIPVLRAFPCEYIYEPWRAPHDVQVQARCIVGLDYPAPVIDYEERSKEIMEMVKGVVASRAIKREAKN